MSARALSAYPESWPGRRDPAHLRVFPYFPLLPCAPRRFLWRRGQRGRAGRSVGSDETRDGFSTGEGVSIPSNESGVPPGNRYNGESGVDLWADRTTLGWVRTAKARVDAV